MNTKLQEEEKRKNREEYVRRARESCLVNYYGDQMQSKEKMLRERAAKMKSHEDEFRKQYKKEAPILSFEEGKQQIEEKKIQNTMKLDNIHKIYREGEKLNANLINQKLSRKTKDEETDIFATSRIMDETEKLMGTKVEIPKATVIETENESTMELPIINTDEILEDYSIDVKQVKKTEKEIANTKEPEKNSLKEPENFVTSIHNVQDEKEIEKKQQEEKRAFRIFTIRCIVAFLILTAIVVGDSMGFQYKGFETRQIYEKVVSSELLNQVEDLLQLNKADTQ